LQVCRSIWGCARRRARGSPCLAAGLPVSRTHLQTRWPGAVPTTVATDDFAKLGLSISWYINAVATTRSSCLPTQYRHPDKEAVWVCDTRYRLPGPADQPNVIGLTRLHWARAVISTRKLAPCAIGRFSWGKHV